MCYFIRKIDLELKCRRTKTGGVYIFYLVKCTMDLRTCPINVTAMTFGVTLLGRNKSTFYTKFPIKEW